MRNSTALYMLLSAAALTPAAASADVVFDNGSYSGAQSGLFNGGVWTVVEDFTLTAATTVTGLNWAQHDQASTVYGSTTFSLYSALPASGSTPLFSTTVTATRTANGTTWAGLSGYDYAIGGLVLNLAPGTYYFGINNTGTGGVFTWDQTTGSAQTIAGRWQYLSNPLTPSSAYSDNSVFQIIGNTAAVPEPGSYGLLALGLATLGLRRRFSATGKAS